MELKEVKSFLEQLDQKTSFLTLIFIKEVKKDP